MNAGCKCTKEGHTGGRQPRRGTSGSAFRLRRENGESVRLGGAAGELPRMRLYRLGGRSRRAEVKNTFFKELGKKENFSPIQKATNM
jgi:hypothetical protein